jgi:hypothetical protein
VLLVNVDDELHLVVGAEEDPAAVVDALGDDVEHTCHVAVNCLAAGCGIKSQYVAHAFESKGCKTYLARRPWPWDHTRTEYAACP